jgi:hypothetical protein
MLAVVEDDGDGRPKPTKGTSSRSAEISSVPYSDRRILGQALVTKVRRRCKKAFCNAELDGHCFAEPTVANQ